MSHSRKYLTFDQKKQVRDHYEANGDLTHSQLAEWVQKTFEIRVGRSTISKILKSDIPDNMNMDRKQLMKVKFPEVEKSLLNFISTYEDKSELTDELIIEKARFIRDLLNIDETEFKVSNGWLSRFKQRYGLQLRPLKDTGRDEDKTDTHGELSTVLHQSDVNTDALGIDDDDGDDDDDDDDDSFDFYESDDDMEVLKRAKLTHTDPVASKFLTEEVVNDFFRLRAEMTKFDERRELVRKKSRDIVNLSKQAIFSLHRHDQEKASINLRKAKKAIGKVRGILAKEPSLRKGPFSDAMEEYTEAHCFREYLQTGCLLSKKQIPVVTSDEFLGGVMLFTGEITRYAILRGTDRKIAEVQRIRNLVDAILSQCVEIDFRNSPLRRKFDSIKYNMKKLENMLYELPHAPPLAQDPEGSGSVLEAENNRFDGYVGETVQGSIEGSVESCVEGSEESQQQQQYSHQYNGVTDPNGHPESMEEHSHVQANENENGQDEDLQRDFNDVSHADYDTVSDEEGETQIV